MKIRLYRGPFSGRVYNIRPDDDRILLSKQPNHFAARSDRFGAFPDEPIKVDYYTYVRTRHSHPDGSIYFEWDKPRRKTA